MLNLGLCRRGFDPPSYAVMQQHVFSHNPHMEKNMKGWPCLHACTSLLDVGTLAHMQCLVWKKNPEGKRQKPSSYNSFNFHNQLCQWPSKCMWMRFRDLLLYIHSSAKQHYSVINILQASALGFCLCVPALNIPLPSLGKAVVNYNYAKLMSAHTAASSERCSLYTCLLAVGRSQLFGVWFWSHTCSLLMEFPWLQSRHNLHRSESLVQPHECKLLSGSNIYWLGKVIITPV